MFFVEARYHRDPSRAGAQVRYIAHREEGLTDGRRRELYGIGERYRALRGDEPAIRRALREDGQGLRNPVYFRSSRHKGSTQADARCLVVVPRSPITRPPATIGVAPGASPDVFPREDHHAK